MIRRRILLGVTLGVLFGLGWWAGRGRATGDVYSNVNLFVEILHKVEENYVDPVQPAKLIDGALKGMLKSLDPYSQYLDEKSYGLLQSLTHGAFGGIGVVVSVRDNYPTVISPIEGTPAWNAGMRSGDVIVEIEGKSSAGLSVEDVANLLRGPQGTSVALTVRRDGDAEDQHLTLERRVIETKSVPYSFVTGDHVGYLRLADFSEKSGAETRAALDRLRADGARSLVLDLRQNPGGLLDQAVDVVEQFVPKGTLVVYTKGRARAQDARYYASGSSPQTQWPVVALIDNGSASAAEIVAGALQDLDRALVVGRTSFGKGSVQSVFPLHGRGVALKLTTARYYTPSGRSIHRLHPDSTVADADADDEDDDGAPADSTAPLDSTPRPKYRTAAGRVVYGGGGITPDVAVAPDTLPALASKLQARGLGLRFASRWVAAHPGARTPASAWPEFVAFLREEKVQATDAELAAERAPLARLARFEIARRTGGEAAAARVALEDDPVFARAQQVLAHARVAREVFAAARLPGVRAPAAVPAH